MNMNSNSLPIGNSLTYMFKWIEYVFFSGFLAIKYVLSAIEYVQLYVQSLHPGGQRLV
jgi:hypothetical protein